MDETFDPYLKWLGIPPKHQPANAYRLLGIELFEADPDVIANAADQRMTHLKSYATGKYSQFSQRLLNEIAAARVLLLSPEQKAPYDAQLHRQLGQVSHIAYPGMVGMHPGQPIAHPVASPMQNGTPLAAHVPNVGQPQSIPVAHADSAGAVEFEVPVVASNSTATKAYLRKRSSQAWGPRIIVGLILGIAVAVGWYFLMGKQEPAGRSVAQQKPAAETPPTNPSGNVAVPLPAPADQQPTPTGSKQRATAANKTKSSNQKPAVSRDTSASTATPVKAYPLGSVAVQGNALTATERNQTGKTSDKGHFDGPFASFFGPMSSESEARARLIKSQPTTARLAEPDDATFRQARIDLLSKYRTELAAAKTSGDKLQLAHQLWHAAPEMEKKRPEISYTLYKMAIEMAVEGGHLECAMAVADDLTSRFDMEPCDLKTSIVTKAVRQEARQGGDPLATLRAAQAVADEALYRGDLTSAYRCLRIAASQAHKIGNPKLTTAVEETRQEVDDLKKRQQVVARAEETLASQPDEPNANRVVGIWYGLIFGNWAKGLPHLAQCSDAELAEVARFDLAQSGETAQQVTLGDRWWKLADTQTGIQKRRMQTRSLYWYSLAESQLSDLQRQVFESRLEQARQP